MAGFGDALPEGLDIEQAAPGGFGIWVRTSDGNWLSYRDDRSERYIADRQLLPADVLRPR